MYQYTKGTICFQSFDIGYCPGRSHFPESNGASSRRNRQRQSHSRRHANYGKTEEHLKTLELVLARLKYYGLKVNPTKCKFFQDSVVFCANRIDKEGIHKTEDKIEAVINAPRPQDISKLRSWVALVNYHRFHPTL